MPVPADGAREMADDARGLGPSYHCPQCDYRPPFTCSVCGEGFPSRRHVASHNRYQHGVGYRKAKPGDVPPPAPAPAPAPQPIVSAPAPPVTLPWMRFPTDPATCAAIRDRIGSLVLGTFADASSMTEIERVYWQSVDRYLAALAVAQVDAAPCSRSQRRRDPS